MRLHVVWCWLASLCLVGSLLRAEDALDSAGSKLTETANPKTALGAATAERVLLLHNGKVIKGVIRQSATGYVVSLPAGQLVLPFEQVRLEADDLEDAYRQQRATLPEKNATAHVELARWCLTNGLPDLARKELREALRLEPSSLVAKNMLQRIEDQLLTIKEMPVVTVRNGRYSLLGDLPTGVPAETLGGLSREAAADFVSKVQPLLVNRCATAGCHGPGSGHSFELQRAKVGKGAPKSYSERNLAAVLARIDQERPLSSPLLVKLRGEAKSLDVRSAHGGLSREQVQSLKSWITSISKKSEESAPRKAESDSSEKEKQTKPDLSSDRVAPSDVDESDDNILRRLRRELRSGASDADRLNRSTSDE